MRFFANNPIPDAYYEPNSFGGPVERPELSEPPLEDLGRRRPLQPSRAATTTSASRARCSTCSTPTRRSGCSPTSPRRWRASRTPSSSASSHFSRRSTRTTAPGVRFNFKKPPNSALLERCQNSSAPCFQRSYFPVFSLLFLLLEKLSFATRRRRRLNVKSPRRWISLMAPAHDGLTEAHCD